MEESKPQAWEALARLGARAPGFGAPPEPRVPLLQVEDERLREGLRARGYELWAMRDHEALRAFCRAMPEIPIWSGPARKPGEPRGQMLLEIATAHGDQEGWGAMLEGLIQASAQGGRNDLSHTHMGQAFAVCLQNVARAPRGPGFAAKAGLKLLALLRQGGLSHALTPQDERLVMSICSLRLGLCALEAADVSGAMETLKAIQVLDPLVSWSEAPLLRHLSHEPFHHMVYQSGRALREAPELALRCEPAEQTRVVEGLGLNWVALCAQCGYEGEALMKLAHEAGLACCPHEEGARQSLGKGIGALRELALAWGEQVGGAFVAGFSQGLAEAKLSLREDMAAQLEALRLELAMPAARESAGALGRPRI